MTPFSFFRIRALLTRHSETEKKSAVVGIDHDLGANVSSDIREQSSFFSFNEIQRSLKFSIK
jgi:hypothetical protein